MKDILGNQLYLNITTGMQNMLSTLREMGNRMFESNSYCPDMTQEGIVKGVSEEYIGMCS